MTPGTILFDPNFEFHDGSTGKKLFLPLNDGHNGVYICVKTTSNGHRYNSVAGCQILDRFPNFFVPKHASCLKENTWVQFHVFYEFDQADLEEKLISTAIVQVGVLDNELLNELLVCATHSEDLTLFQEDLLAKQIAALN